MSFEVSTLTSSAPASSATLNSEESAFLKIFNSIRSKPLKYSLKLESVADSYASNLNKREYVANYKDSAIIYFTSIDINTTDTATAIENWFEYVVANKNQYTEEYAQIVSNSTLEVGCIISELSEGLIVCAFSPSIASSASSLQYSSNSLKVLTTSGATDGFFN